MINPAPYIRQAFYNLLKDAISYDGVTLPVYEGYDGSLIQGSKAGYKIIIAAQSDVQKNTKETFSGQWIQNIEVVTEMQGTAVRKHADAIASLIMQLTTPTPRTHALSMDSQLQVVYVKVRTVQSLTERGDTSLLVRAIIPFTLFIVQK